MSEVANNILFVFVHGFKGDDTTFHKFPERVNHIVQETFPESVVVESIVFPAYETKGDLGAATDAFIDWLATLTVDKENAGGQGGGAGKARIVLCGHSMGGLLASDALLKISRSRPDIATALWPRIIGLLAFDTPYLGLHPSVFKHTFTKATTHVTQAKEVASTLSILAPAFLAYTFGKKEAPVASPIPATSAVPPPPVDEDTPITDAPAPTRVYANPFDGEDGGGDTHFRPPVVGVETQGRRGSTSSQKAALRRGSVDNQPTPKMVPASGGGWSRFSVPALYGLGTAAVAAAAAGAYVKRNDVGAGLNWAQDHLRFIGNLWDGEQMKQRLDGIEEIVEEEGIVFRNFYTVLPQTKGYLLPRTFCVLPQPGGPTRGLWVSCKNNLVHSEVEAHCEMFAPLSNDNYFDLGLRVAETISLCITQSRRRDSVFPADGTIGVADSHSPALPQDTYARRPSVAISPNLSAAAGVGAVHLSGTTNRRRSSAGQDSGHVRTGSGGLGIGLGQFGVAAEQRRASMAVAEVEEEDDEEEGESAQTAARRGSSSSFKRMAKKPVVERRERQVELSEEEEMRRSMSEAQQTGPLGGKETLIKISNP